MSTTDKTPWLYRAVLIVIAPVLIAFTAWQSFKARSARYFWQRCGWNYPTRSDAPVWLHAASVGEVIAALPLLEALRAQHPKLPIVISTFTPTGARIAQARLRDNVEHVFLPIDWSGAVARLLDHVRPRCALIMETELWPNLYAACAQRDIPLVIVNARLSARTLRASGGVLRLYTATVRRAAAILARSDTDHAAFVRLGADAQRVHTLGNIKFAASSTQNYAGPSLLPRPYVLAASTHADEEQRIATLWKDMETGGRLLVIAPRHPRRRDEILAALAPLRLSIAVRSKNDAVTDTTQIYLADTLGELPIFFAHADIVIMGGSFVKVGGHNILEPARAGKAIVFGPHMHNFADEARTLLDARAALQTASDADLARIAQKLLTAPDERAALGERARATMQPLNDITQRYIEAIAPYCALRNK